MAAQRTPLAEPSLLAGPLEWITRLVLRFPIATLALGIGAAVFALEKQEKKEEGDKSC